MQKPTLRLVEEPDDGAVLLEVRVSGETERALRGLARMSPRYGASAEDVCGYLIQRGVDDLTRAGVLPPELGLEAVSTDDLDAIGRAISGRG